MMGVREGSCSDVSRFELSGKALEQAMNVTSHRKSYIIVIKSIE